jgi:hypothetical protein
MDQLKKLHILEKNKDYTIVTMGHLKRKLSEEFKEATKEYISLIEKEFKQRLFSVYLNEDKQEPLDLHGINFLFWKEKGEKDESE